MLTAATLIYEFSFISMIYLLFAQLAIANTQRWPCMASVASWLNAASKCKSLCFREFSGFFILCFQNIYMCFDSRKLLYSKSKFACVLQWFCSHAWYLECALLVLLTDVMTDLATSVNIWRRSSLEWLKCFNSVYRSLIYWLNHHAASFTCFASVWIKRLYCIALHFWFQI